MFRSEVAASSFAHVSRRPPHWLPIATVLGLETEGFAEQGAGVVEAADPIAHRVAHLHYGPGVGRIDAVGLVDRMLAARSAMR